MTQLKRLAGLAAVLILTGCTTIPITATRDAIPCVSVDPIRFSGSNDTPETIQQARGFNAVYDAICGAEK